MLSGHSNLGSFLIGLPGTAVHVLYEAAECASPKFKSPPCPSKRMVLTQNCRRTTEHVSDLVGRLWFMRPSFEKFEDASRLLALLPVFYNKLPYNYVLIVILGISSERTEQMIVQ